MPFSAELFLNELHTVRFGTALQVLAETTSTIDAAWTWLREGGPEGGVVIAERQTQGRGKRRRPWAAPAGGLWISVLARPQLPAEHAGRLGIALALAAAQSVRETAEVSVGLKWPNDLVVGARKLGGVLVEAESRDRRAAAAVLSLGLNVNLAREDLPAEVRDRADTLRAVTGREHRLETLAAGTLQSLERLWPAVLGDGAALREEWRRWDALWDAEVVVETEGETQRGEARGIDAAGALVLYTAGRTHHLRAGEISRVRAA